MKKPTKAMLVKFEKAIKAWVCPDSLTSDKSMVKYYAKDRRDLMDILNSIKAKDYGLAKIRIGNLDTAVRNQITSDVFDFIMNEGWEEAITLTKVQKTEYLNHGYGACPKCKAYGVEGGMLEVDGREAVQKLTCNECGISWRDIYTLANIEELT